MPRPAGKAVGQHSFGARTACFFGRQGERADRTVNLHIGVRRRLAGLGVEVLDELVAL